MKLYVKCCVLIFLAIAEMAAIHVGLLWTSEASNIWPLVGVLLIMVSLALGGLIIKLLFGKKKTNAKASSEPNPAVGGTTGGVRSDNDPAR
jgi:hypothetical protein